MERNFATATLCKPARVVLSQVWFQNRRTKWRKKHAAEMASAKKRQEERTADVAAAAAAAWPDGKSNMAAAAWNDGNSDTARDDDDDDDFDDVDDDVMYDDCRVSVARGADSVYDVIDRSSGQIARHHVTDVYGPMALVQ